MIYLVSGVPGSGKTLLAVHWIQGWLKEGREVYTDIEGLTLDGVSDAPDDWRTLPEGSVVLYDEPQRRKCFQATGRAGLSEFGEVLELDTHRHGGYDLVFITQASTRIHHDIRKMVGCHVHVQRISGTHSATLFRRDQAFNENDAQARQQCDREVWRFPKKLFGTYSSAVMHTHKARLPRTLMLSIGGAAAAFLLAFWGLANTPWLYGEAASGGEEAHAPPPTPPGPTPVREVFRFEWTEQPTRESLGGCIESESDCRCFGVDGGVLEIPEADCRIVMQGPLPTAIQLGGRES